MKDLGYTHDSSSEPYIANKSGEQKTSYPTLSLSDKSLDLFLDGEKMPSVGDEFEMTVKLRVCGISDNEWGRRLELNVIESDTLSELDVEEDDDDMDEKPRSKRYMKEI